MSKLVTIAHLFGKPFWNNKRAFHFLYNIILQTNSHSIKKGNS